MVKDGKSENVRSGRAPRGQMGKMKPLLDVTR